MKLADFKRETLARDWAERQWAYGKAAYWASNGVALVAAALALLGGFWWQWLSVMTVYALLYAASTFACNRSLRLWDELAASAKREFYELAASTSEVTLRRMANDEKLEADIRREAIAELARRNGRLN